jgi:hypothetical protein
MTATDRARSLAVVVARTSASDKLPQKPKVAEALQIP